MIFDIKNLPEVVSKEEFISILNDVLINKDNFSKYTIIEYLEILGEKYEKFYSTKVISEINMETLFQTLTEYTEFEKVELMKDLIGIMFQYRVDKYAAYLTEQLDTIKLKDVYKEIFDALEEYEFSNLY